MEVSGAVIRQSVVFRCGCAGEKYSINGRSRGVSRQKPAVAARRWSDESHSLYYASSLRCSSVRDVQRKEVKRIAAFGTELSREFAALYSTGLGLESEELVGDEIRGKMIKEASQLLLQQLNQRKGKEKEMKKRNKEEKAALKAQKMLECAVDSSSTSSSESSDSECEEVMVTNNKVTKNLKEVIAESLVVVPDPSMEKAELKEKPTLKIDRMSVDSCSNKKPLDKIEVCMGGKCKKAGSVELLQELEKKVGSEGAVIGCKCMGRCKQGPNVRVVNQSRSSPEGEIVEFEKKPLCIGVGLEDVGAIVADFLGQNDGAEMGLLAT